jgi:hypothetical protein
MLIGILSSLTFPAFHERFFPQIYVVISTQYTRNMYLLPFEKDRANVILLDELIHTL